METSLSDQETVSPLPPHPQTGSIVGGRTSSGRVLTRVPRLQRFLLGEMIKASSVDVPLLAEFIRTHNIEQNWMFMQLPIGMCSPPPLAVPCRVA